MQRMLPMIPELKLVVTRQIVSINYLQLNHANPKSERA